MNRLQSVTTRRLLSAHTLVLIAVVGLACYGYSSGALDPEFLSRAAASGWHWAILVLISFGLMLLCAATPLPAEAVAFVNGICFGPLAGASITWVSATTGDAITFTLNRRLLRNKGAINRSDARHARLHRWVDKWAFPGAIDTRDAIFHIKFRRRAITRHDQRLYLDYRNRDSTPCAILLSHGLD
jgi:uncharacterized membrane protein YdjX (TVP38/TMEM64 family)